jgi:hypothetical protein
MKQKNIVIHSMALLSAAAFLSVGAACDKSDDDKVSSETKVGLPLPEKIVRKGSGFSPTSYQVDLNLSTGELSYEQKTELPNTEADDCQGAVSVADEIARWKQALSEIQVCYGNNQNPVTDGFVDSLAFYYPKSTVLPSSIRTSADESSVSAEILEAMNAFVGGRQQFACDGEFKIDALIKEKAPCLELK